MLAGFFVVFAGLLSPAYGQATLYPILSNGVPTARYNLVVISEGYTAVQQAKFRQDATNAISTLFQREPFQEYRTWFNAFALAVASTQSGADHPAYAVYRDTYFNSTYDGSDRIITIPAGATGQGKVNALLQAKIPEWDLAILLVNDLVPGGSDGGSQTAIASVNSLSDILVHEVGHVAAGLGDEYTTPNPGYPETEEPNTTRETNRLNLKWRAWIAPSTPLPTPPTEEYQDVVGLFEGAHYHETGWYRPKLNCTMQSQYTPQFCEVCREALVLSLYQQARPVLGIEPAAQSLVVTNGGYVHFSLTLLQPAGHELSVQWQINASNVPGATNTNLALWAEALGNGQHTISAVVADPTPFVRTDPAGLLESTNIWSLRIDLPVPVQLVLQQPEWMADGRFAFVVMGNASQAAVETSTNALEWSTAATLQLVDGVARYTNAPAIGVSRQFFRARVVE